MLRSTLCTVERGTNNGVGGGDTSSSSTSGSNVPQLIRKNYVRSMSNNKKPNHKKIQYMHKVQSKMKPDQHSHTHAHTHSYSRNQKANKRHNREERSSRQKHLTSVKIIWRRQRTKQKKRKETETERNERTNETPKCIVHIASTSPVIASSGHTTTTATT